MRDLRHLPKAHLHLHLDGAIRERTLRQECTKRGISVPVIPAWPAHSSFAAFTDAIVAGHEVLASPDSLGRIVREVVEDAAADGAVWVELSLWPGLFEGRMGPDRDAVALVLDAGRRAGERSGVGVGIMIAANRDRGPDAAAETARMASSLADQGVVSFGLDGDEASCPPAPFRRAFQIATDAGLLSTPHAGEYLGPESVTDALDLLHADRVLHGVRAVEDDALVARLAASGTCLDVCPTSNMILGVCAPDGHPLPALLEAGVLCSINADDPLLFGAGLLDEYELGRHRLGLSDTSLARIAETSIRASGAPCELKTATAAAIDRWLGAPPAP